MRYIKPRLLTSVSAVSAIMGNKEAPTIENTDQSSSAYEADE